MKALSGTGTKWCAKCHQVLLLSEFGPSTTHSSGVYSTCRKCINIRDKLKRERDPAYRAMKIRLNKAWRQKDRALYMWREARKRAKAKGLPFGISPADIIIPQICPVFGITMFFGEGKKSDWSPSLDAIDPLLGYVPDNIQVISQLANLMKNKATPAQLRKFAEWVLKK